MTKSKEDLILDGIEDLKDGLAETRKMCGKALIQQAGHEARIGSVEEDVGELKTAKDGFVKRFVLILIALLTAAVTAWWSAL